MLSDSLNIGTMYKTLLVVQKMMILNLTHVKNIQVLGVKAHRVTCLEHTIGKFFKTWRRMRNKRVNLVERGISYCCLPVALNVLSFAFSVSH